MTIFVPPLPPSGRLGALIFLHGSGSSGADVAKMATTWGTLSGCAVLCPTAVTSVTNTSNFELAGLFGSRVRHARWHYGQQDLPMTALRWALQNLDVDPDRCAIAGHSMGAIAAWNIAARHWESFAALLSINGALSVWERFGPDMAAAQLQANLLPVAIRSLNGTLDQKVPPELAASTIERLRTAGHFAARQILVEYGDHPMQTMNLMPGSTHYDALGLWLGKQRRVAWPTLVRHCTVDATHGRAHWIEVSKRREPRGAGVVVAQVVAPDAIEIQARGVARLTLNLSRKLVRPGALLVSVNGVARHVEFEPTLASVVLSYRSTLDAGLIFEQAVSLEITEDCIQPLIGANA
ncbi:alpha/beta hydrolase-fold protein [Paucibacter sp. KCTC 42545]|uniref:alpha/beta hydrolase-fold protein n=1 Tax=Paucibacter sp. KCTC 42545 TaxID=1768242 RepID=UPI001E42C63A|nr:alpha/beta hydrolase-fold protein [Paucibacter sp. KCTC 42545]